MAKTNKELIKEIAALKKISSQLTIKLAQTGVKLQKAEDIIQNLEWEYKNK